ncbi:MAG: PAS domain S-box protein [Sulfuricurvum sp.]|nr:PAS domain S-box protein [Sulfuricurvum sp.]
MDINQIIEQAHQEWLCALDVLPFPIFLHDKDFRILRCNKAYSQLVNMPYSDIIGQLYYELFPKNDGPLPKCAETLEDPFGLTSTEEIEIDNHLFGSKNFIVNDKDGTYLYSMHILEDITEKHNTEEALRESEEKFRSITASAQDAILMIDDKGNISFWNEAAIKIFGYSEHEAIGQSLHRLIAPERFLHAHHIGFSNFIHTGEGAAIGKTLELSALKKDGTEFPIELSLSSVKREGKWNGIGMIRDITERKQSELSLNRANRALKTLSAGNIALVKAKNEEELLQSVTNVIVEKGGYSMAVVRYAKEDANKSLISMASSGMAEGSCSEYHFSWSDTEGGELPSAIAICTNTTQICLDISQESKFKRWKEAALSHGFISNIALPLFGDEKVFGTLCIYSTEKNAFDSEEIKLLEELANDLAYGIINLRTRLEHEQHATLLRQSLEQSIQTIAATVEARDPYTAGHQRRVSELATAIAQEMNLSEEKIQGIQLAAIIHDLGKIHIPSEILSKPGKLNNIEVMLIQTHPQEGYNILKDVKFPWPIADIILQHHEKVDGSGYPQGLKNNEILLEAKIICVADVIEAMSSHRPYRASLGIDPALDEIERGRGSWYDESVVDACLKLLREKRFEFSTVSML